MQEQQQEVIRQIQIKHLARLADERWASKPSFLDSPQTEQPVPATHSNETAGPSRVHETPAKNKGNPGENWQPESWTPTVSRR